MSKNKKQFQNNVNNVIDTIETTNLEILQLLDDLDLNNIGTQDVVNIFDKINIRIEEFKGQTSDQLSDLEKKYIKSLGYPFKRNVEDIRETIAADSNDLFRLIEEINPQGLIVQNMADLQLTQKILITLEAVKGETVDQLNYLKDLSFFNNYSIVEGIIDKISICLGCTESNTD